MGGETGRELREGQKGWAGRQVCGTLKCTLQALVHALLGTHKLRYQVKNVACFKQSHGSRMQLVKTVQLV